MTLSNGQLAFYNLDLAKQYANQAKEELSAEGVEFPIQLDISVDGAGEKTVRVAQALNTLETNLADFVAVNIIVSDTDTLNAAKQAEQMNWDMYIGRGWGPDYGDPKLMLMSSIQIVETC